MQLHFIHEGEVSAGHAIFPGNHTQAHYECTCLLTHSHHSLLELASDFAGDSERAHVFSDAFHKISICEGCM